ncbi:MAG: HAD family hydrolase [Candidatus Cryptobacteroides sp.]
MSKYKNIIFDIDGTLIDTERTGVLSLVQTVRELLGREIPYDEAYSYFGIPSGKVAPLLGYAPAEHFAEVWEEHFVELMHLMKAFPGVEEMMRRLSEAGCRMGCVTSRNRYEFEKDMELKPLLKYFEVEICAEDTLLHKPDPEPALEFLRRTGATADNTIFVGDTLHDCQCAHGAGIPFLLADWRSRGLQGIAAEHRAQNAEEMLRILL